MTKRKVLLTEKEIEEVKAVFAVFENLKSDNKGEKNVKKTKNC